MNQPTASQRFRAMRQITDSGRGKRWLVIDESAEFPNWVFDQESTHEANSMPAKRAAEWLNAGYIRRSQ